MVLQIIFLLFLCLIAIVLLGISIKDIIKCYKDLELELFREEFYNNENDR